MNIFVGGREKIGKAKVKYITREMDSLRGEKDERPERDILRRETKHKWEEGGEKIKYEKIA